MWGGGWEFGVCGGVCGCVCVCVCGVRSILVRLTVLSAFV